MPAGKLCQPRIRDMRGTDERSVRHIAIAETIAPKFVSLCCVNLIQCFTCGSSARVHCKPHMQPQQRPFRHSAGGERISHRIELCPRTLVVDVRINGQRHEQISIEQPSHASLSIRATSSAENGSLPAEMGKPRTLPRAFRAQSRVLDSPLVVVAGSSCTEVNCATTLIFPCRNSAGTGKCRLPSESVSKIAVMVLMHARCTHWRVASTRSSRREKANLDKWNKVLG